MPDATNAPTASMSCVAPKEGLNRIIWALLLIGLLTRAWLIWSGGQFFWPDEGRYLASRDAVTQMAHGEVRDGLTSVVAQGDHVGFKLLGIIPATLERVAGIKDSRLAATFFGFFSWSVLLLLWGCARRLGAKPMAQLWTVSLAVASTSLTFYVRHLFPYDTSMALALAAFYVGLKDRPNAWQYWLAGALAGAALLVYLGYWLLAGVVILLPGLWIEESGSRRWRRWIIAGTGSATVLLGVWLLDRWGAGTMIANAGKFSTTVFQGDFGRGWRLVWEYFWKTEGVLMLLWIACALWLGGRVLKRWRETHELSKASLLGLLGVVLVYGGLVATSDIVHKFVVYGRSARQLLPFLCLTAGLALAEWLKGRRWQTGLMAALLGISAGWQLRVPFAQEFPDQFRVRAAALVAKSAAPEAGKAYYRTVNVDEYVYEPEVLTLMPEAVLLTAKHPYQYAPYLYEGQSAKQRAQRLAVDHRMKLVRIRIPDAMLPQGQTSGRISMKVRFAAGHDGISEPLLSVGPASNGDLFFVRYVSKQQLVLGMESMGAAVFLSAPINYLAGAEHEIGFFSGTLLGADALPEEKKLYYQNLVSITWDGREILNRLAAPHRAQPNEIHAGYNAVKASSATTAFSGEIIEVRRGGLPPQPAQQQEKLGALRLMVQLPASAEGVPEPLVVVGVPGEAVLGYVRVLSGGRIKLGVEVWGVGAYESAAIAGDSTAPVEVVFSLPVFFPPEGDSHWNGVASEVQREIRSHLRIAVNGQQVLDQAVSVPPPRQTTLFLGRNPVGGSLVYPEFTGKLLQVSRRPLAVP